ncbi:hypothetical protein [Actinomyces lilanjuaniae]|nr:hypothetical protein [Actinomyces lilanjuaniae]
MRALSVSPGGDSVVVGGPLLPWTGHGRRDWCCWTLTVLLVSRALAG